MNHLLRNLQILKRAIENLVERIRGNVGNARLEFKIVLLQDGLNLPEYHLVLVFAQGSNASVVDGKLVIGYHLLEVNLIDVAQSLTYGTGTFGRVERELIGRGVAIGYSTGGAHQALRIVFYFARVLIHNHQ